MENSFIKPERYGNLPVVVATDVKLDAVEVGYCLYMPASLAGSSSIVLPKHLRPYYEILDLVRQDEPARFAEENVYLTMKRMIVGPSVTVNRPGWHADGFGSDDLNYIWYDSVPTLFNNSEFNISDDHIKSLVEFEEQALPANDIRYPTHSILKLDPSVIHRVAEATQEGMRTFVKVSISKSRYNLKGNSINYDLDYSWPMYDREAVRNNPAIAQQDYHPTSPDDDHLK